MTKYKNDFLKQLPSFISRMTDEYDVYFVTFTFKNTHRNLPYDCFKDYFRFFYRRLNQYTLSSYKAHHTKSILILTPEESYQCTSSHMYACPHFHGFLLIHKKNIGRFTRKCLEIAQPINQSAKLQYKLINPYPKSIKEENSFGYSFTSTIPSQMLTISDHDIQKLTSDSDIRNTAFYSNKNFIKSDFQYDDYFLFSKLPKEQKSDLYK